eukprot:4735229-Prymnesium_polylepis.1
MVAHRLNATYAKVAGGPHPVLCASRRPLASFDAPLLRWHAAASMLRSLASRLPKETLNIVAR